MDARGTKFGLDFDFSTVPESCGVKFWVRERLQAKVESMFEAAEESGTLPPRGSLQALRSLELSGARGLRPYWGRRLGSPKRPPAGTRCSHHHKIQYSAGSFEVEAPTDS